VKNGWRTKDGEPVKNMFLFKTMFELVNERGAGKVHWHHVRGHVGIAGNERVDDIARWFAEGQDVPLYRGNITNYDIQNIMSFEIDESAQEKRSNKGKSAYSYLSLVDGVLEKHETWLQCEARVKGKKAKFKKAISEQHEQEIMTEWGL
jgi:ribonuclease HI